MQYGFNTPGYGSFDCCGDTSTCNGPCPADFYPTQNGWTPGFTGGNFGWNGFGGYTGQAPSFNGYYGGSNWGWNPGYTGYAPSFNGYYGGSNWNPGFTGYTGYAPLSLIHI